MFGFIQILADVFEIKKANEFIWQTQVRLRSRGKKLPEGIRSVEFERKEWRFRWRGAARRGAGHEFHLRWFLSFYDSQPFPLRLRLLESGRVVRYSVFVPDGI